MAPQVGLEPTTLRLTGEIRPLHPTTPTNQTQQNNNKRLLFFVSLWRVWAALHGHKADRGGRSKKERPLQTGVFQLAESANIQQGGFYVGGCFAGLLIRINNGPL